MKKLLTSMLCLIALTAMAQEKQRVIIPGEGGINVELLNKPVNLKQDLSRLNLTE